MREHKYRGERVDNGEWVYGYFFQIPQIGLYEIFTGKLDITTGNPIRENYEVIPETVGQYIGLNDKNNREIYENDITRVYGGEYCQGYYEYDNRCIAKWQTCGFDMVVIKEGYGIGLGFCDNSEYIEILGNKTDNPELLQK